MKENVQRIGDRALVSYATIVETPESPEFTDRGNAGIKKQQEQNRRKREEKNRYRNASQ